MEIELINDGPYRVFILVQGPDVTGEDEIFCNILICDEDDHLPEYYIDGGSTVENVLEGLKQITDSNTIEGIKKIFKEERVYDENREPQTTENNEVIAIVSDCYKNNEKIVGKIKRTEYDYNDQGSWNFQIKILRINKLIATLLYSAQKLTPSGLWDNGIEKTQKFTKDMSNCDTIEEFIQQTINNIQGRGYSIKNWNIK